MSKTLTEGDFQAAAEDLGCEVATIKAVAEVEAPGGGFLKFGDPKILFEAHKFSAATGGKYDTTHPRISSKTRNRRLYVGGQGEHYRLQSAVELDRVAALESASWGKFQILGANWKACGFDSLQHFINAMYHSEGLQLRAFVGFCKSQGLANALKKRNWKLFARKYNGPRYYENEYDVKLEAAYKRYLH